MATTLHYHLTKKQSITQTMENFVFEKKQKIWKTSCEKIWTIFLELTIVDIKTIFCFGTTVHNPQHAIHTESLIMMLAITKYSNIVLYHTIDYKSSLRYCNVIIPHCGNDKHIRISTVITDWLVFQLVIK